MNEKPTYEELFRNNPACCFTFDSKAVIQNWNRACVVLYGWTAEQAIGTGNERILLAEDNYC